MISKKPSGEPHYVSSCSIPESLPSGAEYGTKPVKGKYPSPSVVPCADQNLPYMDKIGLKLARE